MIQLRLARPDSKPPSLLFIGAHSDDIEIGCGGTAIELLRAHPHSTVTWVVLSTGTGREREARQAARALLRGRDGARVEIREFRGGYFPSEYAAIKDYFEGLKARVSPDVIFTHHRDDLHQDHRTVGELTWNTFRNHLVLEYEIPKYDAGLGSPGVFMPLAAATVRRKVALLMRVFRTQHARQWFTPSTFEGLMRLRGIECNAPSGYAEAFYGRKLTLGLL
jgi:LmbE family N-acetylglucosaminyl deacetylase